MYEIKSGWLLVFTALIVWMFVFASIKAVAIVCVVCWLLFGCGMFPESWYEKIGNKKVEEK